MPFAKRMGECNNIPDLPKLYMSDLKPYLRYAVQQASWTPLEAACYINEKELVETVDIRSKDKVAKIYFWLSKSFDNGLLHTKKYDDDGEPLKSPGDYIRVLWENNFYVSLKVWAMYHMFELKDFDNYLIDGIKKDSYQHAANLIWNCYPTVSKQQVVDHLKNIRDRVNIENDIPIFPFIGEEYLKKILYNQSPIKRSGRQKDIDKVNLDNYKDEIIQMLVSELGQK